MLIEQEVEVPLASHLQQYFGFNKFKGDQEEVIKSILSGNDTFVIMPTGGGKSLCYQLPALISEGTAIIVSPLIALMKNQVDAIRNYGSDDGVAHFLNSSLTKKEIERVKGDITSGRTKMLYVAPESLTKEENVTFFRDINISFFAIDEAHCISEWGHDFRPEYRRLRSIIEAIGQVPIIALTATATPKVQQDILKNLGMQTAKVFKSSFNRSNLYYEVRPKVNADKEIVKYIKQNPNKSGIIYCLSRKKVEELAALLQANGIKALPYHAGLDAKTRPETQDKFLMEDIQVIVATIAFGMGIDKPDVRFVIHHEIPKSLEGYYQETGRAGRDGGEGNCITFYSYDDIQKLEKFLKGKPVAEQEIGMQLISETVAYAESSNCRRKIVLHYFGEEFDEEGCKGMCDNCRNPQTRFEGEDAICDIIEAVLAVKEKFKDRHVANVLVGNVNTAIKQYKHHELEVFGKGAEEGERHWMAVARQAAVLGFLSKEIENYGILKVTEKGKEYLEKPYSIMLTKDQNFDETDKDEEGADAGAGQAGGGASDDALFTLLKDLRKKIAKQNNVPPYVVFQDPSLEDMTIQYPITLEEMKNISGVGAGKAQKFGKPFVDLIKKYVEDNDIHRPQDMVVKSVVNKSGLKVYIIQSVDRKLPLEDICEAKGVTPNELITEMESIVSSGTKLDLNYYLNELLGEEEQQEIFDFFRTAETDSIEDAVEEFGEETYSNEELRLVRIKFMSDLGN
jgi:ATP-dependent DNA helicase RecQ